MPVRAQGTDGATCLVVLPSDGPSSRQEAVTAAAALQQLLSDPAGAAHRAAAWRQQLLLGSSAAALLGLTADYAPQPHAQQLRRLGGAAGQAACSSSGGSGSGFLAGPAWLAGSSACSASSALDSSCAEALAAAAVHGTRSSSCFLQQSSSRCRSSSPLPQLVLPRVPSRLGGATSAAAAAAAAGSHLVPNTSLGALPSFAVLALAAGSPPAAAALPPAAPPQPPPAPDDPAWEAYCRASLATALAVCMAEAVRQVEVGCAERGRLLAQLWNSYTAALAASLQQQAAQVDALSAANANLTAGAPAARWAVCKLRPGMFAHAQLGLPAGIAGCMAMHPPEQLPPARAHRVQRRRSCGGRQAALSFCARRLAACARWAAAATAAGIAPAMVAVQCLR